MSASAPVNECLVARPMILLLVFSLATLFGPPGHNRACGFACGHGRAAEGALAVVSPELQSLWHEPVHYAFDTSLTLRPIAYWLTERFTYIPDWVDGAGNPDSLPERQYLADYVYAERHGQQTPAWAYMDPNKPVWRPRTFHGMTFSTQGNRDFARRAANWYFHQMVKSLRDDDALGSALYGGAFAHAIQDRNSPVHIWDGVDDAIEREAFEDKFADFGLQEPDNSFRGDPARFSLFWILPDRNLDGDLEGYEPRVLGDTLDQASKQFAFRLEVARNDVRDILTDTRGFVSSHLQDDWTRKRTSAETDVFQQLALNEAAKLTADVWQTAYHLSLVPEPGGLHALLIAAIVLLLAHRH